MKLTNWKKNMLAAALLLVVCCGIYMNWMYTNDQTVGSLEDTLNEDKLMNDTLVDKDEEDVVQTISDYFAAVRLSRQKARDEALQLLQEAMAYDDENNGQSSQQMESIIEMALCEATIESLVIAKGYADCVAYMSDEGISVAVASPEGGMQDSDVAVIADIVLTQTQFGYSDIRVVEVQ